MVSLPQELERRINRFSTDYENNPNVSEAQKEAAHKALMRDFADWEASAQHDKHMALAAFGGSYYGDTESQVDKHLGKATMTAPQYAIEVKDLKAMHKAISDRLPFQIDTKTVPSPGTTPSVPAALRPELTQLLPYEPTDIFQLFPRQPAPDAPSVDYVQHSGNTNEVGYVAELGAKPSLGMSWTVVNQAFVKLAGIEETSTESLQDFSTFMRIIPQELFRSLANTTSNQVINGTGSSGSLVGFTGLLATSGILSRAQSTDTALNAIRKAKADIRTSSYFGTATHVIVNPADWAIVSTSTTTEGLYILDPVNPAKVDDIESVFDLKIVQSTQIASGKAIVLDVNGTWAWERIAPQFETNSYGMSADGTHNLWTNNAVSFRLETRRAIGVVYPHSICEVTFNSGLTPSGS